MNFPKKHIATVMVPDRVAKENSINQYYNHEVDNVNASIDEQIGELKKQIYENQRGGKSNIISVCAGIGLVVGIFTCISRCHNGDNFGNSVGAWLMITIMGVIVGVILKIVFAGVSKANSKSCQAKIVALEKSRTDKLAKINNERNERINANRAKHTADAAEYESKFAAEVEKCKLEMLRRTDPIYVERMDELIASVGSVLARLLKNNFKSIANDPSGDFVHQFVSGNLGFHVFSNGIALQAGAPSFTYMEKGLLNLNNDVETYARAAVIAERVVSYVQGLPSEAIDDSGREYAPGREVALTTIADMYNNGNRFNWEIYDNAYDVDNASYVKVLISCKCVNSRYAPPV